MGLSSLFSMSSMILCACRWPNVATVAKASFGWRLRLLPYIYTAFHDGHESGCPVMRPLFMAFPGDASVRSNNRQWCVVPSGRRHMTMQATSVGCESILWVEIRCEVSRGPFLPKVELGTPCTPVL